MCEKNGSHGDRDSCGGVGDEFYDLSLQHIEINKVSSPTITGQPPSAKLNGGGKGQNGTAHLNGKGLPEPSSLQKKCCCQLKMIHFLCVVIIAVWGLLSLPIIFYHLPSDEVCFNPACL